MQVSMQVERQVGERRNNQKGDLYAHTQSNQTNRSFRFTTPFISFTSFTNCSTRRCRGCCHGNVSSVTKEKRTNWLPCANFCHGIFCIVEQADRCSLHVAADPPTSLCAIRDERHCQFPSHGNHTQAYRLDPRMKHVHASTHTHLQVYIRSVSV